MFSVINNAVFNIKKIYQYITLTRTRTEELRILVQRGFHKMSNMLKLVGRAIKESSPSHNTALRVQTPGAISIQNEFSFPLYVRGHGRNGVENKQ